MLQHTTEQANRTLPAIARRGDQRAFMGVLGSSCGG